MAPARTGAGIISFGNSTKSSFAYQAIAGASMPITPALSLTFEYHFMSLVSDRNYSGTANVTPAASTSLASFHGQGSGQANGNYNHTLLVGIRYAFGVTPPPVPVAAPAPAPAPARSYLVFFDWDKYNLTDRARQIIADAAANSKKVSYTKIEFERLHRHLGHAEVQPGPLGPSCAGRCCRTREGRRAEERDRDHRLRRDPPAGADRPQRA